MAPPATTPLVQGRAIHKSYGSGALRTPVLRGVDLSVQAGAFVVLLGPSGCGKTTLLNLVGALDTPDSGELVVAGTDLARPTRAALAQYRRTTVGFIFQFYNLLPTLTAQENVELLLDSVPGLSPDERGARARQCLDRVGLSAHTGRLPEQLSGGEQQRVAIARALCRRPPLVVADEPTGNLDRASSRHVLHLLKELNRELALTFFIATHDQDIAREADLVLHMEDGVIRYQTTGPATETE